MKREFDLDDDRQVNEIKLEEKNNIRLHILPSDGSKVQMPFYAEKAVWILPVGETYVSRKEIDD